MYLRKIIKYSAIIIFLTIPSISLANVIHINTFIDKELISEFYESNIKIHINDGNYGSWCLNQVYRMSDKMLFEIAPQASNKTKARAAIIMELLRMNPAISNVSSSDDYEGIFYKDKNALPIQITIYNTGDGGK